ncbi:MAG: trypsin-like peptidase domain-containing protein [Oscillospiraceae bacterium]|nr:trypsin-like peptidase domain-containing protein [Oscillospiraceae bacterium]
MNDEKTEINELSGDVSSDNIIPEAESIIPENTGVQDAEAAACTDAPASSEPVNNGYMAFKQYQTDPAQQTYQTMSREPNIPYNPYANQSAPYRQPQQFQQDPAYFQQQNQGYPQYQQPYQQNQFSGQPYPQVYPVMQQPDVPQKPKKTVPPLSPSQKKIVTLLKIAAGLLAAIFLYCIISDIVMYKIGGTNSASAEFPAEKSSEPIVMYQESKPSSALSSDIKPDENGKYDVEGIAALVSPSIVEITAYGGSDEAVSTGSGIIMSENGYILTNAHVVIDCESFDVIFHDETVSKAELVGYDSKSDLAVLHTDTNELMPATLGDSDVLNGGAAVVAIGSPAGLTSTVTSGIVSAVNRQIRSGSTGFYMECIQTDAAISPGNSGGALVNMYGQVVGVTSSKYASYFGSTYEGLGFAISINQALPIAEELMNQGYVSGRVRIGITFASMEEESIQQEFASTFGLDECPYSEGIWITEISEDCDIANTDLAVNDIILSVNGKDINNYDDLFEIIQNSKAGDVLTAECRTFVSGDSKEDFRYKDYTIEFKLMEDTSGDY